MDYQGIVFFIVFGIAAYVLWQHRGDKIKAKFDKAMSKAKSKIDGISGS